MLELWKTKIKKSSPDMLNFYLAAAARAARDYHMPQQIQGSIIKNKW